MRQTQTVIDSANKTTVDLSRVQRASPKTFPPYGHLSTLFVRAIKSGPPTDWNGPAFDVFLGRMEDLYNQVLWPTWDSGWQRAPSRPRMGLITAADFDILHTYLSPGTTLIDQNVASPAGVPPAPKRHLDLFSQEDVTRFGKPFGHFINDAYNANLSSYVVERIGESYRQGLDSKVGGSVLKLKDKSQRPRPYQVAQIFGLTVGNAQALRNEQAMTANSPALFCGHCLQGLLGGSAALTLVTPGSPAELALLQNMVDMGDRRVFAGVHYPSDNIASWILALTMIAGVYAGPWIPLMRSKIWQAIQMGEVYKSVSGGGLNNAYGPALQKLTDAASGQLDWMVA